VIKRVYADAKGETHLTELVGLGFRDIRATTVDLPTRRREPGDRVPKQDFHPAPRRQLVVPMRGAFEIITTTGEKGRFGLGDILFADDVGTKGHTFEDVGDEPMSSLVVGIDPAWEAPAP
jgi:hypothetical protein